MLSVITLFIICVLKTCDILGIPDDKSKKYESEMTTEKEKEYIIENNYNVNAFQGEDLGVTMFDGKCIYYNTPNYVMKYDLYKQEEAPIVAGMAIKCMTDADDYIYGVTVQTNGNGTDCDYLISVSKETGETTIFYKTECPHITSVVFDGENVYYTNESHVIYKLDRSEPIEWIKSKSSADYPYLIGIYEEKIYLTDGTQIETIDIKSQERICLYSELCSETQHPVMYEGYIYMSSDFLGKDIARYDINTDSFEIIVNKTFINTIARAEKIDSFSASDNFVFFNCDGILYYKDLNSNNNPRLYKEININYSCSFNDYAYYISDGKVIIVDIK